MPASGLDETDHEVHSAVVEEPTLTESLDRLMPALSSRHTIEHELAVWLRHPRNPPLHDSGADGKIFERRLRPPGSPNRVVSC
jgi:hypothetical protein